MNQLTRNFFLFLILLLWAHPGKSQVDLFSADSRFQYALHLTSEGKFADAAREWQGLYRISHNDSHLLLAARAWRIDRHPDMALTIMDSALSNSDLIQHVELFNAERRYNETLLGRYIADPLEPPQDTASRHLVALMIAGRSREAENYYKAHQALIDPGMDRGLRLLVAELGERKKYSKFLAGMLGTLLPGAGKIYAGHTWDGLQAFLAVGMNGAVAWIAYRDLGPRSFWPWFFGGMGAGFYLGNIVGSVNTVKRDEVLFNNKLSENAYGYYHTYLLAD